MYFKCIKDGKIVDVLDAAEEGFVKYNESLGMFVRSSRSEADGVLSSDASAIYVFEDRTGYDTVRIVEFDDEEEYQELKEQIDASRIPDYIEPEQDPEEVDPETLDNQPISAEEALRIIFGGSR